MELGPRYVYLNFLGNGLSSTYGASSTNSYGEIVFDCIGGFFISLYLCHDANLTCLVAFRCCAYVIIYGSLCLVELL